MQDNRITSLRALLEQMSTPQLDDMLQEELDKETVDANAVRMILQVLREREKDMPVEVTPAIREAWEKYRRNTEELDKRPTGAGRTWKWLLRIGSVAAAVCLVLLAIPREAEAEGLFEKLAKISNSIVTFFAPGLANDNVTEYVYQTDNPGLQQVYDAVVNLGVTTPVVPTWLPEGYELVECKSDTTSTKTSLAANFSNGLSDIMLQISIYNVDVSHEYHWDGEDIHTYEHYGTQYSIMRNNDRWIVIWFTDRTECSLALDCQEDTLYRILDSIYVTEDKQ